jgi:hypothetical protein
MMRFIVCIEDQKPVEPRNTLYRKNRCEVTSEKLTEIGEGLIVAAFYLNSTDRSGILSTDKRSNSEQNKEDMQMTLRNFHTLSIFSKV